ncbi:MAG: TolC family protein, partial [Pseudomonadota bacterium]
SVLDDSNHTPIIVEEFLNSESFGDSLSSAQTPETNDVWFEAYNDPRLNQIVEQAQNNNLDIEVALGSLDIASAQLAAQQTSLLPVLDGFLSSRVDLISTGSDNLSAGLNGGLSGSFDPDIAGANRARIDAFARRLDQAGLDREDVDRLIVLAVVLDYIDLRRAEARLALLDETLALQEQTLRIVTARFNVGLSAALDVDRAAADLASSRSQRGLLEADQKQASYTLDVLLGEQPGTTDFSSLSSAQVPIYSGRPDLGVPANLLRNRPDVKAAEAALLAELGLVRAERADLMPSLTLPGTLTAFGGDGRDSLSSSLTALLDIPWLDFGRRQAEVEEQRARARAAHAQYMALVLNAHREVEIALSNIIAQRARLEELGEAGARSQSAYNQLEALYREGLAEFIDILDSQRTLIQIREQIVETEANLASAMAQLSASLALKTSS